MRSGDTARVAERARNRRSGGAEAWPSLYPRSARAGTRCAVVEHLCCVSDGRPIGRSARCPHWRELGVRAHASIPHRRLEDVRGDRLGGIGGRVNRTPGQSRTAGPALTPRSGGLAAVGPRTRETGHRGPIVCRARIGASRTAVEPIGRGYRPRCSDNLAVATTLPGSGVHAPASRPISLVEASGSATAPVFWQPTTLSPWNRRGYISGHDHN